jgi:hypothetical protein
MVTIVLTITAGLFLNKTLAIIIPPTINPINPGLEAEPLTVAIKGAKMNP